MLRTLLLALVAFVASCASSGRQFDTTHVTDIEVGVQSRDQIKAWFGEPSQVQSITNTNTGAVKRWVYVYAHSKAGLSTTSKSLVVDFNASGKVCDHAYIEN